MGGIHCCFLLQSLPKVSSRAPVWGASGQPHHFRVASEVSSRAPVWGASCAGCREVGRVQFQVVPPCGGHLAIVKHSASVSSRAPVWGASFGVGRDFFQVAMFQVVPPCGGHPMYQYRPLLSVSVSSRAPVWGASERNSEVLVVPKVSSRAPVWGASGQRRTPYRQLFCFKSCPRVGGIR